MRESRLSGSVRAKAEWLSYSTDVKTGGLLDSRINPGGACLLPEWRPAYRWREPESGSRVEVCPAKAGMFSKS